jgi:NADH dehydrogenase
MQVLVAGGTGFVGTALVRELLARGHDVTVLARDPGDVDLPASVARVAVDLGQADVDALRDAVAGHDAVVNLVALSPLFTPAGGPEAHETVHVGGTEALVAAASATGVDRFVQMSALGADPDGDTHYLRAKGRAERVVRNADLSWVIVRPSVIFGDGGEFVEFTRLLTTPYVTGLPGGGTTRFQPVWVGDVAPMVADCVEDADRAGESYEVGGPEVLTLAEVARRAHAAEGRPLRVVPVPMALARVGLTVAGAVPGVPMGPDQYRSLRLDNVVDGGDPDANDVRAFDVDPTDLRTLGDSRRRDDVVDASADDGSVLVDRATLGLFAVLTLSWYLPAVVDIYAVPGLALLYLPAYVVNLAVYDGGLGLEAAVYALEGVVGRSPALWDAGLVVTYYLVSVLVVTLARVLTRLVRPIPADVPP